MAKAKKSKQLYVTMKNKIGLLSEVSTAVAGAKVNIYAICAYGMEEKAFFMLVTDSPAKAKKALSKLGGKISEDEVISVDLPNKAGELQKVAKKIAGAGIDIVYVYGTAGTGKISTCIFKTADDKKAIKVINK
ncbi:MAG: hypothetical protein A2Y97_03335 [Nitrospirae bacterium RBG_13_39_12]|nr:MAG: hypothetical protein A2Y97_03335 [Nitrospirae bacterium RBG_13_39_12]